MGDLVRLRFVHTSVCVTICPPVRFCYNLFLVTICPPVRFCYNLFLKRFCSQSVPRACLILCVRCMCVSVNVCDPLEPGPASSESGVSKHFASL